MYCVHAVHHVNKPWYAIMQDSLFFIHCLQPTKTHLKKLPEDLKLFYRTFDGFVVEWDVKLKGDAFSHLVHQALFLHFVFVWSHVARLHSSILCFFGLV